MKRRKNKTLFAVILTLVFALVTGGFLMLPSTIRADEADPLFHGLYLLKGEHLALSKVVINITVSDRQSSVVQASYEITNTGTENTSVYMAMPVSGKTLSNVTYRFSPYQYNSVLISGDRINSLVRGTTAQFDMWRAFSFEVPLQAGETKTASITYTIQNSATNDGRLLVSLPMDHIKSWLSQPDSVDVNLSFDARTVKAYNFDNQFDPEPTEITDQFLLRWTFGSGVEPASIRFSYYMVDQAIKDELAGLGNGQLQGFVQAYDNRAHQQVVDLGRSYVQSANDPRIQSLVYLLMADSYLNLGNYSQTMAVYELLGATDTDFGVMDGAIQTKILLNQLACMDKTKDYETLYDTVLYERTNPDLNRFVKASLENYYQRIPADTLEQMIEERKPPTGLELYVKRFLDGEYTWLVIGAFGLVIIVSGTLFYIRRKRKKNNFFY